MFFSFFFFYTVLRVRFIDRINRYDTWLLFWACHE